MPHRYAREEDKLQRCVFQHLHTRGVPRMVCFHAFSGGRRNPIEAAIAVGLGAKPGLPDIFCIHEGKTYCLELKIAKGKLTMAQLNMHSALRAAGVEVAIAYGLDEAIRQLETWQLLRGKAAVRTAAA